MASDPYWVKVGAKEHHLVPRVSAFHWVVPKPSALGVGVRPRRGAAGGKKRDGIKIADRRN